MVSVDYFQPRRTKVEIQKSTWLVAQKNSAPVDHAITLSLADLPEGKCWLFVWNVSVGLPPPHVGSGIPSSVLWAGVRTPLEPKILSRRFARRFYRLKKI